MKYRKFKRFRRYSKGVKPGYRHIWKYKGRWDETKLGGGKGWKINFTATKRRKHKGMGSFGVGTKGAWKVVGIQ